MVPHGPESLRLSWSVLKVLCCGNPELEQAVYLISSHPSLKFYAPSPKQKGVISSVLDILFLGSGLVFFTYSAGILVPSDILHAWFTPLLLILHILLLTHAFLHPACESISPVTTRICIYCYYLYILTWLHYKMLFVVLQCYNMVLWLCWLCYFKGRQWQTDRPSI